MPQKTVSYNLSEAFLYSNSINKQHAKVSEIKGSNISDYIPIIRI